MNRPLLVGVVVVVVVVLIALALILIHNASAIIINAPYAFIIQLGNGSWVVEWFSTNGSLHTLGPFNNLNDPAIIQAMSVVNQFNQQVVPQHTNYQPLASIIVVSANDTGKQGVVVIPVSGNTIELKDIDFGYYTLVAVPQQYATQFMQALDVGYKLLATVSAQGLQYLQYHDPQTWKLVLETGDLVKYSPPSISFGGGYILITNNNTLIPFGFLGGYGYNLPLYTLTPYNGS